MEDLVLYEKKGDIGKITLNKPKERNTITLDVLKKLIELFEYCCFYVCFIFRFGSFRNWILYLELLS